MMKMPHYLLVWDKGEDSVFPLHWEGHTFKLSAELRAEFLEAQGYEVDYVYLEDDEGAVGALS